jgi:hypothetical protein
MPEADRRCFLSAIQLEPFIVGGEAVALADHPWQVAGSP